MKITYFVESREETASKGYATRAHFLEAEVFNEPVLQKLISTRAGISLAAFPGEEDLTAVVAELNRRDIPLDLWFNLPYEEGYWLSQINVRAARRGVETLLNWAARRNLIIRNVGLDLEPMIHLTRLLINLRFVEFAQHRRELRGDGFAQEEFAQLIKEINQSHGVDLYKLPIVNDFAVTRNLFRLLTVPPDFLADGRNHLVSMLYSSFFPRPVSAVSRLIREREIPAIGIVSSDDTDPGVEFSLTPKRKQKKPRLLRLLSQENLERDVRQVAHIFRRRQSPPMMYVHALNGQKTLEKVSSALAVC